MVAHQGLYLTSDMKNNTRLKAPSTVGKLGNTLHHIYIGKKANNMLPTEDILQRKGRACPTLNNFFGISKHILTVRYHCAGGEKRSW